MIQTSRKAISKLAVALGSLCALFSSIVWGSHNYLRLTEEALYVPELPPALDGMTILHITDLHADNPEEMNLNIWGLARRLRFDLVAITGDIVDKNAYQLEPHLIHIAALAEQAPVFFAEGNHDHYSMKKLVPMLEENGVTVLHDRAVHHTYNGHTFEVIGLNDFYTADLEVSHSFFTPSEQFRLALIHQPQHVDEVDINSSPCVVLSGHTHGGQVRLPFLPTLYAPYQKFLPKYGYGAYDLGRAQMFLSKGIGSTGKMPMRFWNRPEICLITLHRAE